MAQKMYKLYHDAKYIFFVSCHASLLKISVMCRAVSVFGIYQDLPKFTFVVFSTNKAEFERPVGRAC